MCEGSDVTLAATGGIFGEALLAADALASEGIEARVLSVHTVQPLDVDTLAAAARETGALVTIEEHTVSGGLGGAVAETLMEAGVFPRSFVRMGLRNTFSSVVGSQQYLRRVYSLDAPSIVRAVSVRLAPFHARMSLKRARCSGRHARIAATLAGPAARHARHLGPGPSIPVLHRSRVSRRGGAFRMVKFRSMVVNADKTGVSSTAATDRRITPVGHIVRAYKVDEIIQLWNVFKGDMSLVGPRPQVLADVAMYTVEERRMLSVQPGITDAASIVFADEAE